MEKKQAKKITNIKSIFALLIFFSLTVYLVFLLLHENTGMGQTYLSLLLLFSMFFTFYFSIGLSLAYSGYTGKSLGGYIFQIFLAALLSLLIVSTFSSQVISDSQKKNFHTVKNELMHVITRIETYTHKYHSPPLHILHMLSKQTTLSHLHYDVTPKNFMLRVHTRSTDIDGGQIFYDSRDKHFYQFHNDTYQDVKNKNDRPKSIQQYIAFQKQDNLTSNTFKQIDGKWVNIKDTRIQDSQAHLSSHIEKCTQKHAASCTAVGMKYQLGVDVKQNKQKALHYYDNACTLEDATGCFYLAQIYHRGSGIEKNISKAVDLYKKSCTLGNLKACQINTNK